MTQFDRLGNDMSDDDSQWCGDPRRCPRHPHVKTSSDDGMFDGVCGECEHEMELAAWEWEMDSANPRREFCNYFIPHFPTASSWRGKNGDTCLDEGVPDDDICF